MSGRYPVVLGGRKGTIWVKDSDEAIRLQNLAHLAAKARQIADDYEYFQGLGPIGRLLFSKGK